MATTTDRIVKTVQLKASRSRVWRALTDSQEFGTWFKVRLETPFAVGKVTAGNITYPGFEHLRFEAHVEVIEPEKRFSFRWHPYAIDPKVDYSKEPMTLVEFTLEESQGATTLTVIESGFDQIPAHRRDEAFRMNSGGWTEQLDKHIRAHVER